MIEKFISKGLCDKIRQQNVKLKDNEKLGTTSCCSMLEIIHSANNIENFPNKMWKPPHRFPIKNQILSITATENGERNPH